jgi:hypothetical protein
MSSDTWLTQWIEIDGAIHSIDAPCREMKVDVGGTLQQFDIGAQCSVWLHGERVKLRILQAADPVHISYVIHNGACLAMQIRVRE